jgi:homogentisate 1,2-dioxygenase
VSYTLPVATKRSKALQATQLASEVRYQAGFGNEHQSEALPGALPVGQRSPQKVAYGLYAEQLSGTAFTVPRASNRRTWLYRIRPSVRRGAYMPLELAQLQTAPSPTFSVPAAPLRWSPFPIPESAGDFVEGLTTLGVAGDATQQIGVGIHLYLAARSMRERYFVNADGEMLVVPQQGRLRARTECGVLDVAPGEILLLPRGMVFRIELLDGPARGYVCENYGQAFRLPERGLVGSDGFANERDFLAPTAAFEDSDGRFEIVLKFGGRTFAAETAHSPLDVVAWWGNYTPYKYDLARFMVIGTISVDHPDPSIYTVLTSPSDTAGVANADFVIFPPRWMVATDTFRPPPFHRNVMSEFMGLVKGQYVAKPHGFEPGGASLHNCMLPHGPSADVFAQATEAELEPEKLENTLAFMFESRYVIQPTPFALETPTLQRDYAECWSGLRRRFHRDGED